jgi:hypothetical protein
MDSLISYKPVTFGSLKIMPVIEQNGIDKGKCKLIITEMEGGLTLIVKPVACNRLEVLSIDPHNFKEE